MIQFGRTRKENFTVRCVSKSQESNGLAIDSGCVEKYIQDVYTEAAMGKEYRAKIFKSGNSLALRLPKELGLEEGKTMILREEQAGFVAQPEDAPRKKIDISGFAGKVPGIRLAPREDFDERPSTIAAKKAAGLL